MKPQTIHYALIATGTIALIISIAAGFQFYISLGYSIGGMIIYGFAGVIIAVACAFMLPTVIGLFQHYHVISGVFFTIVWIFLSILQIYSEFGFFAKEQSNAESARAVNSDSYQTIKQRYQSLQQYSNLSVEGLTAQKDSLQKQIDALEETYNSYSSKYKTKRANIAEQMNELSDKKARIETQISNARNYAEAQKDFASAAKPFNGTKIGDHLHAAYLWGETLTGIPAHTIQVWTSVLIAVFLELWASAAAFLVMKLFSGNQENTKHWREYNNHLERQHDAEFSAITHASAAIPKT
jgi:hypothetical protein